MVVVNIGDLFVVIVGVDKISILGKRPQWPQSSVKWRVYLRKADQALYGSLASPFSLTNCIGYLSGEEDDLGDRKNTSVPAVGVSR
jgi:hypothetical protein